MEFYSTRDRASRVSFRDAIFSGLASDGGLYHPVGEPSLAALFRGLAPDAPFVNMASEVIAALLPRTFNADAARRICERAFSFTPELRTITPQLRLLELYHGPSCAFKDFGASFLAAAMEYLLQEDQERAVILTATSGDTGSAVARAFHNRPGIDVVILYPSGRVSPLQERQLTTVGGNVVALEVSGSFDDCQRMVKEAFIDRSLNEQVRLTSANSINVGRLLPQALYYIYAFSRLHADVASEIVFCVPSGNFGNLTAGILAWRWGLPVTGFIAATNANDVVPEYLRSGEFTPRPSVQTLANAMDVGNPSNFERMLEVFGADVKLMRAMVGGEVVTDDLILDAIRRYHRDHGVFVDPHTAAGLVAAERYLEGEGAGDATVVTLATAHPAKFVESVERATGVRPELPDRLARVMELPKQAIPIEPTTAALRDYLLSR
ncbi:MAG: threonine synthase [Spirochaetaceae bacterium]|nr:MAG: threonine synthase [Spirochaetaceae bacterium]